MRVLLIMMLLTGCADINPELFSGHVTEGTENQVVIDKFWSSSTLSVAEKYCKKFGKHAEISIRGYDEDIYRCVKSN